MRKKKTFAVEYFYTGANGGVKTGKEKYFDSEEEAVNFCEKNTTLDRDHNNIGTGTEWRVED